MAADRVLNMIGLAKKAGRCVSGSLPVAESIKKREAKLVIIAQDASENTKKHFKDMCTFANIPFCFYSDMENIGRFTGKEQRAAAAVLDEGFAAGIEAMIREVKV